MNSLKILIVSGAFYPANSPRSFRTTELVKEFCRQGHNVTLISDINFADQKELVDKYGFSAFSFGRISCRVLSRSTNSILDFLARGVNRLLNILFDYPDVEFYFKTKKVLRDFSGYDILISIAAPHSIHWGVNAAMKRDRFIAKKWIADCGDPFYGNQVDTFKKPFYFKYIERSWCDKCDKIAISHIALASSFMPEFRHKIVEIPQGFNLDFDNLMVSNYSKNSIPTFAYAGSFVPIHRDPTEMLDWLVNYDKPYKFYIFTRSVSFVKKYVEQSNGKIIWKEYVNRIELIPFLSKMDFNVNFMYDPARYAPSKIVDYMIAKRPILNIDYKLDTDQIAKFMAGDYSDSFRPFTIDRFDIANVAHKFISSLEDA